MTLVKSAPKKSFSQKTILPVEKSPEKIVFYFIFMPDICTDKNENQIFLIYKEIQNGSVAKSNMTNGLLIYGEILAHFLIY